MRVLFTTWAWPSHLYAMVPLARACAAAGHEVLVASQPALRREIERCGLPAAVVGADVDAVAMVRGYALPSTAAPSGPRERSERHGKGPRALRMLFAHADSMVDDLTTLARDWAADVLVFEPTALAGPVAAAAAQIPAVRHLYGVDLLVRARTLLPGLLAPLADRHGVTDLEPFGAATVDPTPAGLQVPGGYRRIPVAFTPFNGPAAPAPPVAERVPASRPRVCVTCGHTMAKLGPEYFLAGQVVRALAGAGVDVLAAVSASHVELLGPVPESTRVVVDAPLHLVLPDCDLVVAHGGAGTMLTALHAGLPSLLVPQLPDHVGHAGRLLASGAGEVLTRDDATDDRLVVEVRRLLADSTARDAAHVLRQDMRAQPAPTDVVDELAALASGALQAR